MNDAQPANASLNALLAKRVAGIPITYLLILTNILVFIVMLKNGAGFWHTSTGIQLEWGANFGPATQDGQWWRLATAMFLHFGVLHLAMNMAALWDAGRLVERMYGPLRFALIYALSGLTGNLLSLAIQGNSAVSAGASGAIFGIYGSLLVFLWIERQRLDAREFRWMFWGAVVFSALTITLGFIISGIDNSAHIGGFITGILCSIIFMQRLDKDTQVTLPKRLLTGIVLVAAIAGIVQHLPPPAYRWRDELTVRKELSEFNRDDQSVNRIWLDIVNDSRKEDTSFAELAGRIDEDIASHYEESFEQLSQLPSNPALPSAQALENTRQYVKKKRDASRALAATLRAQKPSAKPTPSSP